MRVEQLLDPSNKLLAAIFKDDPVFPTGEFANDDWLGILRHLGLQSGMDSELFLLSARRVHRAFSHARAADDGAAATTTLGNAAALLKHLTANFAQLQSSTFCASLADIACVPVRMPVSPGAGIEDGGSGGELELARFCDTTLPSDKYLVWSVMPVLHGVGGSSGGLVPNELMRMQLKMLSPPPLHLVLRNLANVASSDTLYRWPLADLTVEACFQKTYDFLWSRWADMSASDRQTLRALPCVPVGDTLVKPSRIFCRLAGDFSPFMFEMPRHLGAHEPLLKALGAKETPRYELFLLY